MQPRTSSSSLAEQAFIDGRVAAKARPMKFAPPLMVSPVSLTQLIKESPETPTDEELSIVTNAWTRGWQAVREAEYAQRRN